MPVILDLRADIENYLKSMDFQENGKKSKDFLKATHLTPPLVPNY